jgi:hypothetical protein
MFPQIPENFEALSATELRALAGEIRKAVEEFKASENQTLDGVKAAREALADRKTLLELATAKDELEAEELSEDEEAEPVAEVAEVAEDLSEEIEETEEDSEEEASEEDLSEQTPSEEDTEDEEVEASVKPAKVRTSTGVTTYEDPGTGGDFTPDKLIAKGGVSNLDAGAPIESWLALAETLVEVGKSMSPSSTQKVQIASVFGNFDEEHQLTENLTANLRKFEPEVMAAMCAPAEPVYDLACWNTDRRPVRGSLASFMPNARGAVTIYPSPSLTDITDQSPAGTGQWTVQDDASIGTTDPSSKECAVIECATPVEYRLYGLWRCLTVQNLLAMTFPELVEAYLNRLAAAHARLAETQLLEAMGTAAVAVSSSDLGYGSTTSLTTSVLNLLALHQESERWDNDGMDAWMPRWVQTGMKMDIMRRRKTNGMLPEVPSDQRIAQMFRDVGVEPHFFIDTPSWASAIPAVQTNGVLNNLPTSVEMVVAPRGKFAVMDRGELSIGVTGNNIYRDNSSNASNNFTMFFENFEALVDTNSCPAYLLTVDGICHNGVQIADVEIDCDGVTTGS